MGFPQRNRTLDQSAAQLDTQVGPGTATDGKHRAEEPAEAGARVVVLPDMSRV
jgi:hypothetical protein